MSLTEPFFTTKTLSLPNLLLESVAFCYAKKTHQNESTPSLIVHRLSISSPSIVHRNYGVSMEYLRRNNGKIEKRKLPYNQGNIKIFGGVIFFS